MEYQISELYFLGIYEVYFINNKKFFSCTDNIFFYILYLIIVLTKMIKRTIFFVFK